MFVLNIDYLLPIFGGKKMINSNVSLSSPAPSTYLLAKPSRKTCSISLWLMVGLRYSWSKFDAWILVLPNSNHKKTQLLGIFICEGMVLARTSSLSWS